MTPKPRASGDVLTGRGVAYAYRNQTIVAQIAEVDKSFERQRAAILARIRNDYDQALRREKLLQADYLAQFAGLKTGDLHVAMEIFANSAGIHHEVMPRRQLPHPGK